MALSDEARAEIRKKAQEVADRLPPMTPQEIDFLRRLLRNAESRAAERDRPAA